MWKHVSYLQRGISHVSSGTECQDSVAIRENDIGIAAVIADGLGSLKNSEAAARTATEYVSACLLSIGEKRIALDTDEQKKWFADTTIRALQDRIRLEAGQKNLPAASMDCTLGFVFISKVKNYAIIGRLGDSAVCVIGDSIAEAVNDGNASANGTCAVMDEDAAEHLELRFLDLKKERIYGFILTSDGLDNYLYNKGSRRISRSAEEIFNALVTEQDPEEAVAARIRALTVDPESPFDDDISIAVLSRADKAYRFPDDPTWLCTCGTRNRVQDTYCVNCGKDFTQIYQNIKFKEYGGRDAFFLQINQFPLRERALIGMGPVPMEEAEENLQDRDMRMAEDDLLIPSMRTAEEDLQDPGIAKAEERRIKKRRAGNREANQSKQGKKIKLAILFLIGLIVGMLISGFIHSGRNRSLKNEITELRGENEAYQEEKESLQNENEALREENEAYQEEDADIPEEDEDIPEESESLPNENEASRENNEAFRGGLTARFWENEGVIY